jgi:phosphoserine phosphatase
VNNHLCASLPDDRFITAFIGFLDPRTNTVTYHSAGQGPILHFKAADRSCDWHKPTHFPMGVLDIDEAPQSASIHLAPGDILALISDGIFESNNPEGEEFGEARVAKLFAQHHQKPLSELAELLLDQVADFAAGVVQADDVTLVFVGRRE